MKEDLIKLDSLIEEISHFPFTYFDGYKEKWERIVAELLLVIKERSKNNNSEKE